MDNAEQAGITVTELRCLVRNSPVYREHVLETVIDYFGEEVFERHRVKQFIDIPTLRIECEAYLEIPLLNRVKASWNHDRGLGPEAIKVVRCTLVIVDHDGSKMDAQFAVEEALELDDESRLSQLPVNTFYLNDYADLILSRSGVTFPPR